MIHIDSLPVQDAVHGIVRNRAQAQLVGGKAGCTGGSYSYAARYLCSFCGKTSVKRQVRLCRAGCTCCFARDPCDSISAKIPSSFTQRMQSWIMRRRSACGTARAATRLWRAVLHLLLLRFLLHISHCFYAHTTEVGKKSTGRYSDFLFFKLSLFAFLRDVLSAVKTRGTKKVRDLSSLGKEIR